MDACTAGPAQWLIAEFEASLEHFANSTVIDKRYELYLATVRLRTEFPNAAAAVASDEFVNSVHETLRTFFNLARAGLRPLGEFVDELRKQARALSRFDGVKVGTEPEGTDDGLWDLISKMKLTANELQEGEREKQKSKLVSGSKALNLVLPDLVVPVDRQYTSAFLYRYADEFNAGRDEQETFRVAFAAFHTIAMTVHPESYVGTHRLHATPTKVIDNALIGFVDRARAILVPAAPLVALSP